MIITIVMNTKITFKHDLFGTQTRSQTHLYRSIMKTRVTKIHIFARYKNIFMTPDLISV